MFKNLKTKVTNRMRLRYVTKGRGALFGVWKTKEGYIVSWNKQGEVEFVDPETGAIVSV